MSEIKISPWDLVKDTDVVLITVNPRSSILVKTNFQSILSVKTATHENSLTMALIFQPFSKVGCKCLQKVVNVDKWQSFVNNPACS